MKKITFGYKNILLLLAILSLYCLTFFLSGQDGEASGGLSGWLAKMILRIIKPSYSDALFDTCHTVVRKLAHMSEFCLLSILWYLFFRISFPTHNIISFFGASLLLCIISAAGDEIHQLYIPGRAGLFTDVLIDTAGGMIGLGFAALIPTLRRRKG